MVPANTSSIPPSADTPPSPEPFPGSAACSPGQECLPGSADISSVPGSVDASPDSWFPCQPSGRLLPLVPHRWCDRFLLLSRQPGLTGSWSSVFHRPDLPDRQSAFTVTQPELQLTSRTVLPPSGLQPGCRSPVGYLLQCRHRRGVRHTQLASWSTRPALLFSRCVYCVLTPDFTPLAVCFSSLKLPSTHSRAGCGQGYQKISFLF